MTNLTRILLAAALSMTAACGNSDVMRVTSPAQDVPIAPASVRVVLVDGHGSAGDPVAVTMGELAVGAASVRVIDARGQAVTGVPVEFRLTSGATFVDGCTTSVANDVCLVLSDAAGIATAGSIRTAVRDTVADLYRLTARLAPTASSVASRDTTPIQIAVRATRDLSRFGGSERATFSILPIDRRAIAAIMPLGTFSTDDALPSADAIVVPDASTTVAVRAMADGLITELDATSGTIMLRVRDQVRVRVSGIAVRTSLWVGKVVTVGDTLGAYAPSSVVGGQARGVAIRVFDGATQRVNWVRPERYGARSTTSFFARYLADSVRSNAFALVRRAAPDLDGRIDYDRAGQLIGTWFDPSATVLSASIFNTSTSALIARAEEDRATAVAPLATSFVYDAERPGQVRVALGSGMSAQLGLSGVRAVAWDDADPAAVGVANGIMRYHLYATDDEVRMGAPERVLLVQLLDDATLRLEVVMPGAERLGFTARAITLVR